MCKKSKSETTKTNKQNHINTKDRQDDACGKQESVLKNTLKKLKKTNRLLPLVLTTREAFVEGLNNCGTCRMDKEDYKQMMEDVTVIGMLVDSVVEKEQKELIENSDEDDKEDVDKRYSGSEGGGTNSNNNTKPKDQVEEKCPKTNAKHSLRCVLIKLQKCIGDVMVQVCFVKSNHLGNTDKYRKFDITLDDLRLFKFEYTNVTDKIISLFKTPQVEKLPKSELCVICLKEKLFSQVTVIEEMVKSGKNLKLAMRNQNLEESQGQCCDRDYPHIHAQTQGRPVVLKYTRPFNAAVPPSRHPNNIPPITANHLEENKDSENVKSDSDPQLDSTNDVRKVEDNNDSVREPVEDEPKIPGPSVENASSDRLSGKDNHSISSNYIENKPSTDIEPHERLSLLSAKKDTDNKIYSSNDSIISTKELHEKESPIVNSELDVSYCGCNFEQVYNLLNVETVYHTLNIHMPEESNTVVNYNDKRDTSSRYDFLSDNNKKQETSDEDSEGEQFVNKENNEELNTDNDIDSRTPFGSKIVERTLYVDPGESNIPRKKRVSFADDLENYKFQRSVVYSVPSTSNSVMNGSVLKATDIKKDKSVISENTGDIKEIKHHNKKVEMILRSLGADSLLMFSSPAKCSEVNTLFSSNNMDESSLPLSPSLYSLPLDINDLKYIAKEVERRVLLLMEQEEDIPVAAYECEKIDITGKTSELKDTKLNRALAGNETPYEHSYCKKMSFAAIRKGLENDYHNPLPTIEEEDTHIRHETSINNGNQSNDINKGNTRKNNHQTSRLKKSTELRYCMVEFENKNIGEDGFLREKEPHENNINNEKIAESNQFNAQKGGSLIQYNISQGEEDYSFLKMGYSKNMYNNKSLSTPTTHNSLSRVLEQWIMLNAIYLNETELQNEVIEFNVKSPYNKTLACEQLELPNQFTDTSYIL